MGSADVRPGGTMEYEPNPLGAEISDEAARLYSDYVGRGPGFDDVYKLWADPGGIDDLGLRQRLVTVLTAPSLKDVVPYAHPKYTSIASTLRHEEIIKGKKEASLRKRMAERPDLASELGRGVLYWTNPEHQGQDHKDKKLPRYQEAIIELLPVTDLDDHLTSRFGAITLRPEAMEYSHDTGPLVRFLNDPKINRFSRAQILDDTIRLLDEVQADDGSDAAYSADDIRSALLYQVSVTGGLRDRRLHTKLIRHCERTTPNGQGYLGLESNIEQLRHMADGISNSERGASLRMDFVTRHLGLAGQLIDYDTIKFEIKGLEDLAFVRSIQQDAADAGISDIVVITQGLISDYETRVEQEEAATRGTAAIVDAMRAL